MYQFRARVALSALCLGSLAASAPAQGFAQPFQPGLRWIHSASLTSPWIPTRVSFAAGGELVWVGTEAANRRLLLFAGPDPGVVQPVFTDESIADAAFVLAVAAGPGAQRLFTLAQYPETDLLNRRSVLIRHDALAPSLDGEFDAVWTFACDFVGNGPAHMEIDEAGQVVALAVLEDSPPFVRVHHIDAESGAALLALDLVGDTLDALALSGDGEITAVSGGRRVTVFDSLGNLLHGEQLSGSTFALALDQDGSRLVIGATQKLRVYDFDGSSYQLVQEHLGGADEAPLKVAISADGQTYAAAWYKFGSPDLLSYEVYGGSSHSLLNQVSQVGMPSDPQNAPVDVVMTADGRRIAFASWGLGNSSPEVVLLERGVVQPLLEIDLPGSALGIDLDENGIQLAVVTKNLHANQVGSTGEIRLYDTGERDIQLLSAARLGGSLEVASKKEGAGLALFLVGARSAAPSTIEGMVGELCLARTRRLRVFARPADAEGRADLVIPISTHSVMVGIGLSVQVANRVGTQIVFSDTVLDPLFY